MIAQVVIRQRTETCVSRNGFCPDWIRTTSATTSIRSFATSSSSLVSVAIGFAIAFALALLAHRRRWLVGPVHRDHRVLYTIPSIVLFFAAAADHSGFGFFTGVIPLVAYTLLIIFRNIVTGLAQRARGDARRGPRHGPDSDASCSGASSCRWRSRRSSPALRIATTTTVGLATLAFFAGAGGLGEQILTDIAFKSNIVVAGGLCVLLAFAFDAVLLVAQRSLAPWRRVAHDPRELALPISATRLLHLQRPRVRRGRRADRRLQLWPLLGTHLRVTVEAMAIACADRASRSRSGWDISAAASSRPRRSPTPGAPCRPSRCSCSSAPTWASTYQPRVRHGAARHPADLHQHLRRRAAGRSATRSTPPAAWA